MDKIINPVKQNIRVKQFLGWFIALVFPFAVTGIMQITKMPILAAMVYWGLCGVALRIVMEKKLPYFNMQIDKVKKEVVFLILITVAICFFFYGINMYGYKKSSLSDELLNLLIFALLNGSFEQLVWINIIDLAGCKDKMLGFAASAIYVVLIHFLFWFKFMPMPQGNIVLFILAQGVMYFTTIVIYAKTNDITIWSIQHVIYNAAVVLLTGFGATNFLTIH